MASEHHTFMDGKLHLYKRENSRHWQCSTFLNGRNWRKSTKEESFSHAKDIAEDWYLELRGKARAGILKSGKTFAQAAKLYLAEYVAYLKSDRNPLYEKNAELLLNKRLIPFFGNMPIREITGGTAQDYRLHRSKMKTPRGGAPARITLHNETVILRQVLKFCHGKGWLDYVPELSPPYKASSKVGHRAWFSPAEYKQLYEATRRKAAQPHKHKVNKWRYEQLHDLGLIMANTGLRPDEVSRLEFRDVTITKDKPTDKTILEIEVRGKRGVGWCKSMPGAVAPFRRLQARLRPSRFPGPKRSPVPLPKLKWVKTTPTDRLFPTDYSRILNELLIKEKLKTDRDGKQRTAYSWRHTYICFRLMEGADIYQIAKNCRTSVKMIEDHYARHIKNVLDTTAINVTRGSVSKERKKQVSQHEIERGAATAE